VEEALEDEAAQELGRGYRNGYRTGKVQAAEGIIVMAKASPRPPRTTRARECRRPKASS
jgi:hypothetical protein